MAGGFTFAGKLETTSFPEIAGAVYRLGKSGELKVAAGKRTRVVWFLDGNPVAVTSDDPRDHLARVLEESGKISAEDGARLEKVPEEKDALQAVDFVPRELLMWGLKSRFVQLCYDIFRWTEGEYRFQEATPPRKLPLLKVPTPTMILKGVSYLPPAYLRRRVPSKGTIESGAVPPEEAVYLAMEEKVFLEACREGGEAGDVVAAAPDPEEARRRIFAFLALGLLSLRPPIQESPEEAEEPPVMDLAEESIIPAASPPPVSPIPAAPPPPRPVAPPAPAAPIPAAPPPPRPAPPPAPAAPVVADRAEDDGFGDEPLIAPMPTGQPLQGVLPYQGKGVTIPPPAPKKRSLFLPLQKRGLLLVIAGFGIVLLVAAWRIFVLLTTPAPVPAPAVPLTRVFPTPRATAVVVAAASPAATTAAAPTAVPAAPTAVPAAPTAVPVTPTAVPTAPAAPRRAATVAAPAPAAPTVAPAPPVAPRPVAAPGAGSVDRYREGLDVYRSGDHRKAADVWAALFAGGAADIHTVQIEVACATETITKDFPPLEKLGQPFILPRSVKGKACFALCLGRFPTKADADAALRALPPAYAKDGAAVKPIKALLAQ